MESKALSKIIVFLQGLSSNLCALYCTQERTVFGSGILLCQTCPRFAPVLSGRLFSLDLSVDAVFER